MTLNEFLDIAEDLNDKKRVACIRDFLSGLLKLENSALLIIEEDIARLMSSCADLENDDFFGTEGMDLG